MNKRIGEAFDQIHAEDELKNKTMEFLAQQTGNFGQRTGAFSRQKKALSYRKMVAAAASLALILLGTGGCRLYFIPTTSIDIEINPSVSLGINRFDKVVTMESHNEDGSALLNSVNVKYADYTDAINEILAEESIAGYLAQDEIMEISVTGSNDRKNQEILTGVESCTSRHKNIRCYNGNSELAAEARESGLSMGKYQAYQELKEVKPDVTVESVQGMTMREICDLADEAEKSCETAGNGESHAAERRQEHQRGNGMGEEHAEERRQEHKNGNAMGGNHAGSGEGHGNGRHDTQKGT